MPKENKKTSKCALHNEEIIDAEIGCASCVDDLEYNLGLNGFEGEFDPEY